MIPLWIFLIAWLILMAIYAIMVFISVVQMLRYGISSAMTSFSTIIFLSCIVFVLGGAGLYFLQVDWTQTLTFMNGLSSSTIFNIPTP